jgi:hypothetical protein
MEERGEATEFGIHNTEIVVLFQPETLIAAAQTN